MHKCTCMHILRWWDDTSLAPPGAEGAQGFSKACAVSIPGEQGACVVTSKDIYMGFVDVFERALALDADVLQGLRPVMRK
jgi:hypothetical protein